MTDTAPRNPNEESEVPIQPIDLETRLREVEGLNEDIANVIAQNWRPVLIAVLTLLVVVWLVNEYNSAQAARKEGLAKEFIEAQQLYENLVKAADTKEATPPEGEAKPEIAFREKLRALVDSGQSGVYAKAAALYQAQSELTAGNTPAALEILRGFALSRYESNQQVGVSSGPVEDTLFDELATLLYCKGLLVGESADIASARRYLVGLAYNGNLLNAEAVLLLVRISDTDAERQEAATVAHDVAIGRPELADTIESSIAPYGVSTSAS